MQTALAILTYSLTSRLAFAVQSLEATGYRGEVAIIDDGSTKRAHLDYLSKLSKKYHVIRRPSNGGVSRAKNTCLRWLQKTNCDFGFIAEDDIEFCRGWSKQYIEAHRRTGVHHFSWASDAYYGKKMKKYSRTINGYVIMQTSMVNGVLMTVTPEALKKVGGFKIMPHRWGHEHTNWTRRMCKAGLAPFYADIVNSNRFIRLGPRYKQTTISRSGRQQGFGINKQPASRISPLYLPLRE